MKRTKRLLLGVGCFLLLAVSWLTVVTVKSDARKQMELIEQATAYIEDEIYIKAAALLEEAASYDERYTFEAEEALKRAYLNLMDTSGYRRKYTNLLEKQMAYENAAPEIFAEAAQYYLDISKETKAFSVLVDGIEKTGSEALKQLYEESRYMYRLGRMTYQDVTTIYNGAVQVFLDGYWGMASADGTLMIPCEYDKISTYSNDQVVVQKERVVSAVNSDNNRVALCHETVSDFSNYGEDRLGLKTESGWILSNGNFDTASLVVDEIGMCSGGCIPARLNGKWGLLATNGEEWVVEAAYDGIIQDELGRCYAQDAVFVKKDGQVLLLIDGEQVGDVYEDARPFADGWAAVKKNGKWGFIDTAGVVQIEYQFDDALSFGQHLAAVQIEDRWGYISLYGELVIETEFLEAKSFGDYSAPVKTADGWRFITLLEYQKGASL